ncbi:MAG: hypothetical protein KDB00_14925 [Planctomycetales bacterium]|nr:hypothetical protein [Planctomycetales bacterium]
MPNEEPVDNLIQDDCEQLKQHADWLIEKVKELVFESQDVVLDRMNSGLAREEIETQFLQLAKDRITRMLEQIASSGERDRIAETYEELGNELRRLSSTPDDPDLLNTTEVLWEKLRTLQQEEASAFKIRYENSLALPLGRASEILDQTDQLKKKYANPSQADATTNDSD